MPGYATSDDDESFINFKKINKKTKNIIYIGVLAGLVLVSYCAIKKKRK